MNNEDYCSYEIAQALARCSYDGQYDYMYATENFCSGNNPISFDTISAGERISECVAYYVNDDNEDAYRGIPCPTLAQAAKWLREKGYAIEPRVWLIGSTREYRPYIMPPKKRDYIALSSHDTYESALSAGIEATLKLIEEGEG